MSLSTLPTELFICIATHLLPCLRHVDSLAKASKLLYAIANPILYRHEIFNHDHGIFPHDSPALLWAARYAKPDACNCLLREGANPNTQDPHHRTPVSWAAGKDHEEVFSFIRCSEKIDPTPRPTTDTVNSEAGDYLAVVKLLLSAKDIQPDRRTERGETPLAFAAAAGAEDVVEELLRTGKVDANSKDEFGQAPLMAAARNGHIGIVKRLLAIARVDADADARSQSGDSPLLAAARNGHAGIVKFLLAIPTVDPNQEPSFGDRALLSAVFAGHTDVVKALLANERVGPSLPSKHGVTTLVRAAQWGRTHIIRLLLAKGVDPDGKDGEGSTPLMIAAERGHVEAVKLLLSAGRVQAEFDLTKRNRSSGIAPAGFAPSVSAPSELIEDVVRVLDDYKSRRRCGSSLDS